jgi:hypothetical protein
VTSLKKLALTRSTKWAKLTNRFCPSIKDTKKNVKL